MSNFVLGGLHYNKISLTLRNLLPVGISEVNVSRVARNLTRNVDTNGETRRQTLIETVKEAPLLEVEGGKPWIGFSSPFLEQTQIVSILQ